MSSADDDEQKKRLRREKLEAWKRKKELSKKLAPSVSGSTFKVKKPIIRLKGSSRALTALKKPRVFNDDSDGNSRQVSFVQLEQRLAGDVDSDTFNERDVLAEPSKGDFRDNVDPLDEFMEQVNSQVQDRDWADAMAVDKGDDPDEDAASKAESNSHSDDEEFSGLTDKKDDVLELARRKLARKKSVPTVNHELIAYEPFQRAFYHEPAAMEQLSNEMILNLRKQMDGIQVRGRRCPKPCQKWTWLGLSPSVFEIITTALNYEKPTPIQAQAIPAIMSGFDVMGVAKTGSGKTMAFLLPLFRHVKAQRPLEPGEGPIALIMTPTRELAVQINRECRMFKKALGISSVCAYGGSSIRDQIAELKRGAQILIGTPGRLIDLLAANSGRVVNLLRVTFLVLDEADRMFDMGFEPQVMKIVQNIRPDRQTILFSATFPKRMEALARKVLINPIEIVVGGKSVVCSDVEQHVLVVSETERFNQLLLVLGRWSNDRNERALVFVDRQEAADTLLRNLQRRGYVCGSLHGGKDQYDRDFAIKDFKDGVFDILVATSLAARGLDVKQLTLVVNYDCPNHMEDYIHRCGRTGRAGKAGVAYTFVTPDQGKYAVEIERALLASQVPVPPELERLSEAFKAQVKLGKEHFVGSGFGGKGLEHLSKERDAALKQQRASLRNNSELDFSEDENESGGEQLQAEVDTGATGDKVASSGTTFIAGTQLVFEAKPVGLRNRPVSTPPVEPKVIEPEGDDIPEHLRLAREAAAKIAQSAGLKVSIPSLQALSAPPTATVQPVCSNSSNEVQYNTGDEVTADYAYEIEINDFPQKARWAVTNKDLVRQITDATRAQLKTKGTFVPPGKELNTKSGERKLYLLVEGDTQQIVDHAKTEIKRVLASVSLKSLQALEAAPPKSRYTV